MFYHAHCLLTTLIILVAILVEAAIKMFSGHSKFSLANMKRREIHRQRNSRAQAAIDELERIEGSFDHDGTHISVDPQSKRRKQHLAKVLDIKSRSWLPSQSDVAELLCQLDDCIKHPPVVPKLMQPAKPAAKLAKPAPPAPKQKGQAVQVEKPDGKPSSSTSTPVKAKAKSVASPESAAKDKVNQAKAPREPAREKKKVRPSSVTEASEILQSLV